MIRPAASHLLLQDMLIRLRAYGLRLGLAVVAAFLIIPRALIDYGQSGDAIDNAADALKLASYGFTDGIPLMIRWPPGVPLFIYSLAAIVPWGGHVGANLLVFSFYGMSVFLFHVLAQNQPNSRLLTVLFALTPMIVKNAAVTQDFVCGLAMVLGGSLALLHGHRMVAAGLFGLSAGFRLTNILFLIPSALLILQADRNLPIRARLGHVARVFALAIGLGFAAYLPFVASSGMGWHYFAPAPGHGQWGFVLGFYNLIYVFGPIALLGMIAILLAERRRVVEAMKQEWTSRCPLVVFSAVTIVLYMILSFRFTMKQEYFMPALPFVYILLSRWVSNKGLVVIAILIVSYTFVSLDLKGGASGKRVLTLQPAWGLVADDLIQRRELQELRRSVGQLARLGKAVVLTGMGGVLTRGNGLVESSTPAAISPRLDSRVGVSAHRGGDSLIYHVEGSDAYLVFSLSQEDVELLRQEGYKVYMFSEYAPSATMQMYGYDPYTMGIDVLPVLSRQAFYRSAFRGIQ